ncbi:MAG: CDP-alcohol phosphatidyltransferase family protein [Anaerolineae bacterium]|jgi:CDP-diacylglycerol--glycerol-3-phosphate 3-phosphatidyltransferase
MSFIEQKARDITRPMLESVARTLAKWKVSPNAITYLGLVLTLGVAVLVALGELRWAGVAYIVASASDAMDGTLARVSGKGSRFGAFLDSTIDRFEESLVFLGLIFYYAQTGSELEVTLTLLVTVGSLMVSYTRARAEGLGISCKVGFMTRIPRVAILIAALILNQVLIALIILAVTTLWTTGHRMVHAWKMTGGEAGGWAPPKDIFISPGLLDEEDKGDEAAEIEA